jgi:hypothetical protein
MLSLQRRKIDSDLSVVVFITHICLRYSLFPAGKQFTLKQCKYNLNELKLDQIVGAKGSYDHGDGVKFERLLKVCAQSHASDGIINVSLYNSNAIKLREHP